MSYIVIPSNFTPYCYNINWISLNSHCNSFKEMNAVLSELIQCSSVLVFHSIQHHFIHFKRSEWKWVVELEWNDTFVQLPLNQSILSLLRFNEWMWFDFIGPFTSFASLNHSALVRFLQLRWIHPSLTPSLICFHLVTSYRSLHSLYSFTYISQTVPLQLITFTLCSDCHLTPVMLWYHSCC